MAKRELKAKTGKYSPRGKSLGKDFMKEMASYPYLMEYTEDEKNELDVQLRGTSINIYYQGGSLVKLSGRQKCEFDKNYFYLPGEEDLPMSDIERLCGQDYTDKAEKSKALKKKTEAELKELREKAIHIKGEIERRRDELVGRLKSCDSLESVGTVVEEMKEVMRRWKAALVNSKRRKEATGERAVQHYISLYNKKFDDWTDFVVLDIEYAISANARYAKETEREKQPRIDILAVEKGSGQVYVMELKYGMKSVDGGASVEKHYRDYLATVGSDDTADGISKWQSFIDDVKTLFEAKKKPADRNLQIKESKPVFAFVVKLEKATDESSFRKHIENSEELRGLHIPTLYLPAEKDYGRPSVAGHKLSKRYMK